MNDRHHPALYYLFFTEMWERFSYYGMRALLVLYLVKHLKFSDLDAGIVYGAYTGLVYLTPLLGGYLSDNYLGNIKSIYIGGILMMFGHMSLAVDSMNFFYTGLFLLICGNGFFKPNISTLLGRIYESRENLRDSAFTIFYMGINIGGSMGPLLCGYIGEVYGWHYGFSLAGIGMLFGLIVFRFSKDKLAETDLHLPLKKNLANSFENLDGTKGNVILLLFLAFMSIFFWVPYEQMGTSVNLYTDRNVDRVVLNTEIPASVFQSLNGFLILAFAPILAYFWQSLSKSGKEISIITKFASGFFLLGLSYLSLLPGGDGTKINLSYLMIYYILLTIGELCVSPVGLSMVSKLAPRDYATSLMGVWFLSNAISHYVSGWFSGAYSKWMGTMDLFLFLGCVCMMSTLVIFLLFYFIKKYFPEINQKKL